jgi:hypothetical protein
MPPAALSEEALVAYLTQAIARSSAVYATRPVDDPQHPLALGEVVALFNLADEFGLIGRVRQAVDAQLGHDVYGRLSEAMKRYYLGLGGPARGRGPGQPPAAGRPAGPRPPGPRPPTPPRGEPPRARGHRPPA